jgi:hypothetical protein
VSTSSSTRASPSSSSAATCLPSCASFTGKFLLLSKARRGHG